MIGMVGSWLGGLAIVVGLGLAQAVAASPDSGLGESGQQCPESGRLFHINGLPDDELSAATPEQRRRWVPVLALVRNLADECEDVPAALSQAFGQDLPLWGIAALIAYQQRDLADLLAQVPEATTDPVHQKQYLHEVLDSAPRSWLDAPNLSGRIGDSLAWALTADSPDLRHAAERLLARTGDPQAQTQRVTELLACGAAEGGTSCLLPNEYRSAHHSAVEDAWKQALSDPQRALVVLWAARTDANIAFFSDELLSASPGIQYMIFEGPLQGMPDGARRIALAKALLRQAIDDPAYRPPAIAFDAQADSGDLLAERAFASTDIPFALDAAFNELATLDDEETLAIYAELDELDHPWLSTRAGMARFAHDFQANALHLLRNVLEADGMPAAWVLERIDSGIGLARHTSLIVAITRNGTSRKWALLSRLYSPEVELKGEVLDAVLERIGRMPEWFANTSVDLTIDGELEARLAENDADTAEVQASIVFAERLVPSHSDAIAAVGRQLQESPEMLANLIGLGLLVRAGDPNAMSQIRELQNHPDEHVRNAAERMSAHFAGEMQ